MITYHVIKQRQTHDDQINRGSHWCRKAGLNFAGGLVMIHLWGEYELGRIGKLIVNPISRQTAVGIYSKITISNKAYVKYFSIPSIETFQYPQPQLSGTTCQNHPCQNVVPN